MEAPAPLRPFFASIFDAALPDLDFKFSFYNIRFPKLAASRGERSLYEKHQTQKERPLLVAWQRPLLRTAEHSGPSSLKVGSHRLRGRTVMAVTRFAIGI